MTSTPHPPDSADPSDRRNHALPAMMGTVTAWSLLPMGLHLSDAEHRPLLYNAWFRTGIIALTAIFLMAQHRRQLTDSRTIRAIARNTLTWPGCRLLLVASLGSLDHMCLAWSTRYIDVTVSAVLFETYPAVVILSSALMFRRERRYRPVTLQVALAVALSIAGAALAVASQEENPLNALLSGTHAMGAALALTGALGAGICTTGFRWAANLSRELAHQPGGEPHPQASELCLTILALLISSIPSAAITLAASSLVGETAATRRGAATALANGVIAGLGAVAFRKANLSTTNLGINTITSLIPALSIAWLVWIAGLPVPRLDLLAAGAAVTIAGNLLAIAGARR